MASTVGMSAVGAGAFRSGAEPWARRGPARTARPAAALVGVGCPAGWRDRKIAGRSCRPLVALRRPLAHAGDVDLSAYRFLLDRISHAAVLGAPPPEQLDRTTRRLLATGEPTTLPKQVLQTLRQRRARQIRLGPWVERHHRPGQPF